MASLGGCFGFGLKRVLIIQGFVFMAEQGLHKVFIFFSYGHTAKGVGGVWGIGRRHTGIADPN